MGFKEARALLIEALRAGRFIHEERSDIDEKNLLSAGAVAPAFVIRLLLRCAGWEYRTSRHHFLDVDCHVFTPTMAGDQWYVKAYLEPGRAVFISVHR
ncbi:MAG TPA: hypothetical protein VHG93_05715 [Longimicrobium sp.]|nr:hypothetical protein [Longimicrobium sp.]